MTPMRKRKISILFTFPTNFNYIFSLITEHHIYGDARLFVDHLYSCYNVQDEADIKVGDTIAEVIFEGLQQATIFMPLVTSSYGSGFWCGLEVCYFRLDVSLYL